MTTPSPVSAFDRPAVHGFRLWPDEYEELREEARAVVSATTKMMAQFTGEPPPADPLARAKADRERLSGFLANPVPEGESRDIAGRHCRVFRPEHDAGLGVLYLHFHGGGMKGGLPEMNDAANLAISRRHGIPVVSASYRLAPEDPYPAGVDDGVAVARWLLDNAGKPAAEGGLGARRIIIGGVTAVAPGDPVVLSFDSCGGCAACRSGTPAYCASFELLNMSGTGRTRQGSRPRAWRAWTCWPRCSAARPRRARPSRCRVPGRAAPRPPLSACSPRTRGC